MLTFSTARPGASADLQTAQYPREQLKIVHAEVDKQRERLRGKHDSMFSRASLVVGAGSAAIAVQGTRLPAAFGVAMKFSNGDHFTWLGLWAWLSFVLAIGTVLAGFWSASQGVRSLSIERGSEVDVEAFRRKALGADAYSAEWALVRDKIEVHKEDYARLVKRSGLVSSALTWVVAAWALGLAQFVVVAVYDTAMK